MSLQYLTTPKPRSIRHLRFWICALASCALASSARAQEVQIIHEAPSEEPPNLAATLALGAAGALTAFLAHESGHVLANLMLGNVPRLHGTKVWGFLPFPVISPDISCYGDHCVKRNGQRFPTGRNGSYLIVTAGFDVQHITNEIVLTLDPNLKDEYAPFLQGLVGFNILLSGIYAVGAYTGLEDPHGDLQAAAKRSGIHEGWLATLLLVPAVLDVYRFFYPTSTWSAWASRAGKASLFGLTFVF